MCYILQGGISLFVFVSIATEGAPLLDLNVLSYGECYHIDSRSYAIAKRCRSVEFKSFRAASLYANISHLCLYTERLRFQRQSKYNLTRIINITRCVSIRRYLGTLGVIN